VKKLVKNDVKKVAVAISGGIDSLVAAYILKQKGLELFGIHFTTGYEELKPDLSFIEQQLGIEIKYIDVTLLFEQKVVNYFLNTYLSGKTPNPCIVCNKQIKFGALLDAAKSLGAHAIATGHYAKIEKRDQYHALVKGADKLKEQSYFLSLLTEQQLNSILFPLGDLTKTEVKKIALQANLAPVEKKESQDICFLQKKSIAQFFKAKGKTASNTGNILTLDKKIIGKHKGIYNFTIGQRKGINCPAPEAYYVKKIDIQNNNLIVCFKNRLLSRQCSLSSLNFIKQDINFPLKVTTKIRYNHMQASSILKKQEKNDLFDIRFEKEQFAITPGQTAVFYDNDEVIGSGVII